LVLTWGATPGQSDGQIAIDVLGGTAPHSFTWSTGEVESSIQVGAGSYSLTVSDSNGCTMEQSFTVASAPAPEVGITVDQPLVLLGTAIQFGTSVADYDEVHWDFGDGNASNGPEVAHTYLAPGTYTVTQTIVFGACSSSTTTEVVVELTTGVEAAQQADITARVEGDHIVIMHPDDTKQLRYELRDAAGRLVMDRAATGSTGRVLVPAQGLATGVWVLTVRADQEVRTFRLPVVR
jgi:PKD repeat protein